VRPGPPAPPASWTAAEAERWLLSLELFGMRFGLDRMHKLMAALGRPNEAFRAIHVVGTNGKSSTTRMIAALLTHHGVRTGAYLSPHLVSFAERVRVDGADISPGQFAAAAGRARTAAELVDRDLDAGDRVTQFEALTAAAYAQLAESGVEAAVVEAGLGGRWDATNVIGAEIAVLTNISLEHTRWLGSTVAEIAREKLAVLAPGATLVLGADLHPDADAEAELAAQRQRARIVRAPREPLATGFARGAAGGLRGHAGSPGDDAGSAGEDAGSAGEDAGSAGEDAGSAGEDAGAPGGDAGSPRDGARVELLARGEFQRRNFAVACTAAEVYLGTLDPASVRAAAMSTAVPGRFEVLTDASGGALLLDGAHNAGGIEALVESLPAFLAGRPLVAVVSVLDDKDARAMLAGLLALCDGVVFTASANPRARRPEQLAGLAGELPAGVASAVEGDPRRALAVARELAGPAGVVLSTGSIYLVADLKRPSDAGPGSML
jgi:dihydrofolate synthase/folylpolyglutamate synthase